MARKTRRNSITDSESLAALNPENARLISDFMDYLRSTQKSETTIAVYLNDLQIAMVWCLKHNGNKVFVKWTKRDIISFQNWLVNVNGNSPARVRRIKATLSSLSNYIENILDDEYEDFRNIIHRVESPMAQPVREKTVLSDEQIQLLLDTLVDNKEYDKACLLALAAYSGRRKAELPRFRVDDFKEENLVCNGALYKTTDPIKTKGRGSGKYIYCYTLAKKFKPYFDLWMEYRHENGIDSAWLFPSKDNPNVQLPISTLNSWSARFEKIAGVPIYLHCLRHSFTTSLVRAGLPDSVIAQIVGWESVDMCKIYTDIEADEQISMYFDGNGEISTAKKGLDAIK